MNDLQKKLQDRWRDRRSKKANWTKLITMVAILAILLYVVNRLNNSNNIDWKGSSTKPDTVQVTPYEGQK
jgi:hypothetical protein